MSSVVTTCAARPKGECAYVANCLTSSNHTRRKQRLCLSVHVTESGRVPMQSCCAGYRCSVRDCVGQLQLQPTAVEWTYSISSVLYVAPWDVWVYTMLVDCTIHITFILSSVQLCVVPYVMSSPVTYHALSHVIPCDMSCLVTCHALSHVM